MAMHTNGVADAGRHSKTPAKRKSLSISETIKVSRTMVGLDWDLAPIGNAGDNLKLIVKGPTDDDIITIAAGMGIVMGRTSVRTLRKELGYLTRREAVCAGLVGPATKRTAGDDNAPMLELHSKIVSLEMRIETLEGAILGPRQVTMG